MMLLNAAVSGDLANAIVNLGIIIFAGLFMGRLFEMMKIPAITGYLVAGLFLGPITGIISLDDVHQVSIITDVALGFIAFQVGNELWFGKLRKSGTKIVIITIVQAVATTGLVIFALQFFVDLPIALILGAIAAATSPAEIMMLNKKYRTKGELTDTILPVVGLDDAVGVILFGLLLSISMSLLGTDTSEVNILHLLREPLIEIGISAVLGIAIGLISGFAVRNISSGSDRKEKSLNVVVITVFLTTGAALLFGASPILTPMLAGTVVTNLINKECYILEEETIRFFVPPIMITFFTLAGAQLQFDVVFAAGLVGIVYILGRVVGKFAGAFLGATMVKSGSVVKKYLGIGLLPQSGVAIGLSIATYNTVSAVNIEAASIIQNVVLAAVLVFALTGPVLVKLAYFKAGEAQEIESKVEKVKSWKNTAVYQK
ncbi:cation:proton antiporter [Candidatus Xianfuyuplasma coldseepsis]|uniref:Cation:proton antiporter n=1 Tax=Candidatus Xianfuyuplasma coldseepsis TaxID=2782163 RepID=A0A7L7KUX9_9MOLU|nr:cation:proton antiporter [Xianfuyuplasma coldseepsis]QMS85578.1 cation:proton antiporter [Xianfuyuplasma coldseepsis]